MNLITDQPSQEIYASILLTVFLHPFNATSVAESCAWLAKFQAAPSH